ncbi:hypothetical protein TSAR_003242, partial [Trichomalopsis sarcophagae]
CFYDEHLQAFKIYDLNHFEWDIVEEEDFCERHIANLKGQEECIAPYPFSVASEIQDEVDTVHPGHQVPQGALPSLYSCAATSKTPNQRVTTKKLLIFRETLGDDVATAHPGHQEIETPILNLKSATFH